jgi:large repetitive protein
VEKRTFPCLIVAAVLGALTLAGCDGRTPSSPTREPTPTPSPSPSVSLTAIQPNSGATNGTTIVRIVGTGFEPGAIVTLGAAATDVTVVNSTTITATVPTHPVGTVDVIVTNTGGQSARLNGGFSYVTVPRATVTAISPNIGSTEGGTSVTITGTDFHPAATVTMGGAEAKPFVYQGSIHLTAPAHGPGVVDVVVTNPGTEPHTLAGAYTYAFPASFDFNGTWDGDAGSDWEFSMQFTVENNLVTSVRCGGSEPVNFTTPVEVLDGAFAFSEAGRSMTGAIVAPSRARGTIDIGACRRVPWYAMKR